MNQAKNNEKHPLHFNNVGDDGFSGKKKTDAHRDIYYQELEDQFYTFLNDSQSRVGKSLISQGYIAKRLGADEIPLSKTGKEAYGKEKDTSKADIVFQHPTRQERVNYSSLKKASGAVSASAGAEETAGNYTIGMKSALKFALKSGRITKDQLKELEQEGSTRISALKDAMASSKGMSKEKQRDLLPELDRLRGEIERIIPGTERETAKEQLSGEGKYGRGIDSFLSTGRGGTRKTKPEEVSGTNQRMRLGKGQTKPATGPREQRPVTSTGDIKAPKTGDPSTFASFSKKISPAQQDQQQKPTSPTQQIQQPPVQQQSLDSSQIEDPLAKEKERIAKLPIHRQAQALSNAVGAHMRVQQAHQQSQQLISQPQTQQPTQSQPQQTSQPVQPSVPQPVSSPEDEKEKRRRETRQRMDVAGQRLGGQ